VMIRTANGGSGRDPWTDPPDHFRGGIDGVGGTGDEIRARR
jgi:hypothetical protein